MNRMRFGAVLVADGERTGFYLSHRAVLTVPSPGHVRAVPMEKFSPRRVFVRNGVAVACFEAMLAAAETTQRFADPQKMMNFFLDLPENSDFRALYDHMRRKHGAVLREFAVTEPETPSENLQPSTGEMKMEMEKKMNEFDAKKEFDRKYEEMRRQFGKRPNILVCGYTGSGKSSLAKAILGDVVPDSAIGDGAPKTMGYDCYENELVRIWDSKGLELGETEKEFTETTRRFVRERQNAGSVDDHIHLVWYTIQGPGARVTECDRNLIANIFSAQNVIVVITKSDITRANQKEALKAAVGGAGVPESRIVFTSDLESGAEGCRELMDLSYRMLPEAYRDAFMEAQRIDREAKIRAVRDKRGRAKAIIAAATAAAAAAGAIPIPLSDAAVIVPIQVGMIASLAGLYGLREEAIRQSAWPFVAKLVGIFAASTLLKLIPGLGSAVNATVAGTITGAMGAYVRNRFEEYAVAKIEGREIPPITFDPESFRRFYEEYRKHQNKEM